MYAFCFGCRCWFLSPVSFWWSILMLQDPSVNQSRTPNLFILQGSPELPWGQGPPERPWDGSSINDPYHFPGGPCDLGRGRTMRRKKTYCMGQGRPVTRTTEKPHFTSILVTSVTRKSEEHHVTSVTRKSEEHRCTSILSFFQFWNNKFPTVTRS